MKKFKQPVTKEAKKRYKYLCPACTKVAIETSNKMMGVNVECQFCKKIIKLDDPKRYIKI